ncbi:MAG TPA: hypothetical protein VEY95_05590 [Azospirillaceae bacterium]|nr:hypothetical protein [Azospirillaceae bacterium]
MTSMAGRVLAGTAAVWLALAAGVGGAQDTADEGGEYIFLPPQGNDPRACGETKYPIETIAPVPVRGLAPGFRALHLAREDSETHRKARTYVDAATSQLFTGYVVTRPDGGERFGLHNLHTGWYLQLVRSDTGSAFPRPTTENFGESTRGVERRIGLKANLQELNKPFWISLEGMVQTAGHRHLVQDGYLGAFGSEQNWTSYICRSVDSGPTEDFFLALVHDQTGRVVPDACAAVRDQGADALLAVPARHVSHLVTEEDRLLSFVYDHPVVVVDAGLDGQDIRVDGGVLVVAKAVVAEIERTHGNLPSGTEEWSSLSDEEISRHVLERACRTGPRP